MAEHRTYKCTEENGETKCDLVKSEPSCEDKVTFITKDDSCSSNEE